MSYSSSSASSRSSSLSRKNGMQIQLTSEMYRMEPLVDEASAAMKKLEESLKGSLRAFQDLAALTPAPLDKTWHRDALDARVEILAEMLRDKDPVDAQVTLDEEVVDLLPYLADAILEAERRCPDAPTSVPFWARSLVINYQAEDQAFVMMWAHDNGSAIPTPSWPGVPQPNFTQHANGMITLGGSLTSSTVTLPYHRPKRARPDYRTGYLMLSQVREAQGRGTINQLLLDIVRDIRENSFQTLVEILGEDEAIRSILGD